MPFFLSSPGAVREILLLDSSRNTSESPEYALAAADVELKRMISFVQTTADWADDSVLNERQSHSTARMSCLGRGLNRELLIRSSWTE